MTQPEPHFDPQSHPLYEAILKMVLWGESRELVFDRLRVNGVEVAEAEAIYLTAHRERVATFRREYHKRIGLGLLLIAGGLGVLGCSWFGLYFIHGRLLWICSAMMVFGLWKLMNGVIGTLTAGTHPGSVADDF